MIDGTRRIWPSVVLTLTAMVMNPAQAQQYPNGLGICRGTATPAHELRFTGEASGTMFKGKARAVYPFALTYSNGLEDDRHDHSRG